MEWSETFIIAVFLLTIIWLYFRNRRREEIEENRGKTDGEDECGNGRTVRFNPVDEVHYIKPIVQRDPEVFFDIEIDSQYIGRLVFTLDFKNCPITCENFLRLAKGEQIGLSYLGCLFHRIIRGFMIQGGDFTNGDGSGGKAIYEGGTFPDECLEGKHDRRGVLSMANKGADTNGSQFFITLAPAPHLDGKHVVFGEVKEGYEVLDRLEQCPTDENDRPQNLCAICNCGTI